jgi:hypothetical protein
MADIKVTDLKVADLFDRNIAGSELFNDSEDFMVELSEDSDPVIGGMMQTPTTMTKCGCYSGCFPTQN